MNNSAGLHLIMDVYVNDSSVLNSRNLTSMFRELANILDMTIIMGPEFKEVPVDAAILEESKQTGRFLDCGGVTGFCVISTSHMSAHCWELESFASIDIFSCKNFDSEKAEAYIIEKLGCTHVSKTVVKRTKPEKI